MRNSSGVYPDLQRIVFMVLRSFSWCSLVMFFSKDNRNSMYPSVTECSCEKALELMG